MEKMRGYYSKGINKKFPACLVVPYNFSVYEEKSRNKIEIHYEPNVLEETVLKLIKEKKAVQQDVEAGIVKLINIPDNFLREFRDLIWKKRYREANKKLLCLFNTIKTIKSNYEELDKDDRLFF